MKHNNISNKCSPKIIIEFESLLIFKPQRFIDRILLDKLSPFARAEIDFNKLNTLYKIIYKTDYSIALSIPKHYLNDTNVKDIISIIPYNEIIEYNNPIEISCRLIGILYDYYVSDNTEINNIIRGSVSLHNYKKCINYTKLDLLTRGGM